ncbi:hypothetical protein FAZ69_21885 [Trinickia terrae]|uniref:Uncharacterized protein n=1 Tax=Trinickia terrae TaxID=2571161 RepID=A0A4U1HYZ4_9BURK|nr:hypothetical protein [Trinickia terrae]TKC85968.1 hypothetical protein FAZ69_21885 [Trinickia terrae]
MAFHIVIEMIDEEGEVANYRFKSDGGRVGVFKICKSNGEVKLIEQMPGDEGGHIFNRAAVKVMREWKRGKLPSVTEWAS